MINLVAKLSRSFSHVRVHLYNVDKSIHFGETAFTTVDGYRLSTFEKDNYSK